MSNDKVVNVALTLDELNLVLSALAELPAKVSMNLIGKVTAGPEQQLQAPAEEVNNG